MNGIKVNFFLHFITKKSNSAFADCAAFASDRHQYFAELDGFAYLNSRQLAACGSSSMQNIGFLGLL